ncbi:MAG TPA: hypothetical protein VMW38_28985 [Terriglobia bacterium]|nr:hypothetical protein [Terriglobia bacterium]
MSAEIKYVIFKEFPNGIIRQVNMKPLDTVEQAESLAEELSLATGTPHYWMEMPPEKQSLYPTRTGSDTVC